MRQQSGSLVLSALAALFIAGSACAQPASYPTKPIRFLVGFAPAGAADYVARVLSEPLARALGQPVIVENRAGAGSSIAADLAAKAPADGIRSCWPVPAAFRSTLRSIQN